MNNLFLSFFITTIAGLSTLLGTIIIFIKDKNQNKIISNSLIFSASIMLYISILDLIPTAVSLIKGEYSTFIEMIYIYGSIMSGMIIMFAISKKIDNENNLYKVGIISIIALILHNIPEGIITFLTTQKNQKMGIKIAFAIALHNIPEGISISIPIYYSTKNKIKAFKYTLISGFSELIGAIIAFLFLRDLVNDMFFTFIYSITAGIMIYISFNELIPESLKRNKSNIKWLYFLFGIIIMFISELII